MRVALTRRLQRVVLCRSYMCAPYPRHASAGSITACNVKVFCRGLFLRQCISPTVYVCALACSQADTMHHPLSQPQCCHQGRTWWCGQHRNSCVGSHAPRVFFPESTAGPFVPKMVGGRPPHGGCGCLHFGGTCCAVSYERCAPFFYSVAVAREGRLATG